jgi:hypothetical protein
MKIVSPRIFFNSVNQHNILTQLFFIFFCQGNLRALYLGDNLFETFPNDHIDKLQNLQIVSKN